ncbi:MAG: metallophosphoesterase family protein [Alkalispirochaetaceae bacterium]
MKILCVSDHIDPLVYSVQAKERFKDIDLVVSAGDLPMEYLGFLASTFNLPVIFVFGNHNLEALHLFRRTKDPTQVGKLTVNLRNYYGSTYAGDRSVRAGGLIFVGLGGSMRYNNGKNQFSDAQMMWRIIRLIPRLILNKLLHRRYLDILLTHAPPLGIHDRSDPPHRGFKSFLWFMRTFKPRYLLHGHIHLYDLNARRVTRYHETRVINVYDHYLLTLGSEEAGESGDEDE